MVVLTQSIFSLIADKKKPPANPVKWIPFWTHFLRLRHPIQSCSHWKSVKVLNVFMRNDLKQLSIREIHMLLPQAAPNNSHYFLYRFSGLTQLARFFDSLRNDLKGKHFKPGRICSLHGIIQITTGQQTVVPHLMLANKYDIL